MPDYEEMVALDLWQSPDGYPFIDHLLTRDGDIWAEMEARGLNVAKAQPAEEY